MEEEIKDAEVADVVKFLEDRGYRENPPDYQNDGVLVARSFSKIFRDLRGKRHIHVTLHTISYGRGTVSTSAEVESIFEAGGIKDWVRFKFYSLRLDELLIKMDEYERQHALVFELLLGEYDD